MNKERTILPAFIIADIYKNHLIQPDNELNHEVITEIPIEDLKHENQHEIKSSISFLGQNKKRVIILIADPQTPIINDDELAFLTKILNACNFNLADIAIINTHHNKVSFEHLKKDLYAEYILLLGIEPASIQLPFTMPNFQVQTFSNCTIISAPALSFMQTETPESTSYKRQLWTSLQKAFKLN